MSGTRKTELKSPSPHNVSGTAAEERIHSLTLAATKRLEALVSQMAPPLPVKWAAKRETKRPEMLPPRNVVKVFESAGKPASTFELSQFLAARRLEHAAETTETDEEQFEGSFLRALTMLKGIMFKPDQPFRTRLGYYSLLQTSAAGVLNQAINVNTITGVSEWTAVNSLFDEFFVHTMAVHFEPRNIAGGGTGTATAGQLVTSGGGSAITTNTGIIWIATFNGGGAYTSAQAMLPNPTRKLAHTAKSHVMIWRNNVRFDKRGPAISASTTESWQGWSLISNGTNVGGQLQVRAANDDVIGTAVSTVTLGTIAVLFDVSLRARQ